MYTILMLNQKGGVGKTTIADELSFALERRGKTVAFVTTDPQGGSVHEVCDDPDFAEECDFQVVDTAGVLVGGVNDWCRAANLILVPMLPSTRDMEPTLRTLDIVRESGTGAKAYGLQDDGDADVTGTGDRDGLLNLRDSADVGELIEDEMHRGREFPAIIRKGFSAQLVDGLPHEDGEQETEGLVGIGEDAENRHLRIWVTKGVNLHLVIGQKLAHAVRRDGRKAHVAGNEDGF